jgi:hypothetical protein
MIYCLGAIDRAEDDYGADSYLRYWPTLLYSVVPVVSSIAYEKIAIFLNDYEAYPTQVSDYFSKLCKS